MTHARQPFHIFWWPEARYARPTSYGCASAAHALAFSHALAGASYAEGGLDALLTACFLWVSGFAVYYSVTSDVWGSIVSDAVGSGLDFVSGCSSSGAQDSNALEETPKEQAHRRETVTVALGGLIVLLSVALISVGISLVSLQDLPTSRASASS